jgi:TPR repeat protein
MNTQLRLAVALSSFLFIVSHLPAAADPATLQAAEAGDMLAQNKLACEFELGMGEHQDYIKAEQWYGKAVGKALPVAEFNLASLFERGKTAEPIVKREEIMMLLRRASTKGYVPAILKLAQRIENGDGVEKDLVQAHVVYNVAAIMGTAQGVKSRVAVEEQLRLDQIDMAHKNAEKWLADFALVDKKDLFLEIPPCFN